MSDSYPLPTEPEGIVAPLLERFHSGKVSATMALYHPEAVFIANDRRTITDHTEIAADSSAISGSVYRRRPRRDMCRWRRYRPDRAGLVN